MRRAEDVDCPMQRVVAVELRRRTGARTGNWKLDRRAQWAGGRISGEGVEHRTETVGVSGVELEVYCAPGWNISMAQGEMEWVLEE